MQFKYNSLNQNNKLGILILDVKGNYFKQVKQFASKYNLEKDITFGLREILKTEEYDSVFKNKDLDVDAKKFYLMGIILDEINEYQRAATSFLRASWFFNDLGNKEWMVKSKKIW